MEKIVIGLVAGISLWGASSADALMVSTSSDAATLAGALGGAGITISNAQYDGLGEASGWFDGGFSLGISKGIILTTGRAADASLPPSAIASTQNNGLDGSGFYGFGPTYDFASLKLDVMTPTGNLFFGYRFASEEIFFDSTTYGVTDFNDRISIFLDGNAITPFVSVHEAAVSPGFLEGSTIPVVYNGLTPLLFYGVTGLDTAIPHVLEIGIADGEDDKWDSAILIGPLSAAAPVPEPSTIALLGLGLGGIVWSARKRKRS